MESLLPGHLANKPVAERVNRLHYRILELDFCDIAKFDDVFIQEVVQTLVPLFRGTNFVGVIAELRDAQMIADAPSQALLGMMKDNLFAMAWKVPSASLYREGRKLQLQIDPVVPTRIVASRLEALDFISRKGVEAGWLSPADREKLVSDRLLRVSNQLKTPAET